jgi:hypothetical protein
MSNIVLPGVGKGLLKENGMITLNFDPIVKAEKRDNGVYIPSNGFGSGMEGSIDNWTVVPLGKNADNNTMLQVNHDVVVCIYTLSRRKVTNRTSVSAYKTSDETKTIFDIVNEFNCAMDGYKAKGQNVPDGMPHTSYLMTVGDLFQFRENARPWISKNGDMQWPCAMDDMNRYEDDVIKALFYVTDIEYKDKDMPGYYMTKLSIRCVWSELNEFVAGQTYTTAQPEPTSTSDDSSDANSDNQNESE